MLMRALYALPMLLVLAGCDREEINPNRLLDDWTSGGSRYTFAANGTYQLKYLYTGYGADTLLTDSIWGAYLVDEARHNVELRPLGHRTRSGLIVNQPLPRQVWNVTFPDDKTLRYESRTAIGFLTRQ